MHKNPNYVTLFSAWGPNPTFAQVSGKCSNDLNSSRTAVGTKREDCGGITMETSCTRNENQKSVELKDIQEEEVVCYYTYIVWSHLLNKSLVSPR